MDFKKGALLDTEDNRDISVATVAAVDGIDTGIHPKRNVTYTKMLTVEDQKRNGSCVGQAEGKDAEFQNFKETGKVVQLSKRALYAMCKKEDGLPEEGTYPRVAASIRVKTGIPKESLVDDDNSLPHAAYINVPVTNELKTSASEFRSKGYASVTTLDELKTAIDLTGAFPATIFVGDWRKLPVKAPYGIQNAHRIWIKGYEDVEGAYGGRVGTKIYFRNSWGVKWAKGEGEEEIQMLDEGGGWFWWHDFSGFFFRDAYVYLDMPNEIIDYVKSQQYRFPRQLQFGMRGTDVMELQKRLANERDLYGRKCFDFGEFTTYFGTETEKAVKRYQEVKSIVSSGTPATTGYGRLGPRTLQLINEPIEKHQSDSLEKWADAIQYHEGWYAGSRSFRNNNPGNIKFIGQKRAIGQDDKGFAVFANYTDGKQELIEMLIRAATGKSSIYRPQMTLVAFFEKYAPSSDNNNPQRYAEVVANMIGCSVLTTIGEIYEGIEE